MRIPIGVSNFKELIKDVSSTGEHHFYCDKTLMIKDIIDDGAKVLLFTRPRRFGKTLNMSMLSYFFGNKEPLFDGLEISNHQEIIDKFHGLYPVVFISFKGLKYIKYQDMFEGICEVVRRAFAVHRNTFDLTNNQFSVYFDYSATMTLLDVTAFLLRLSGHLQAHYGKPVLILIDEYDAPIQTGYINGYYEEIVAMMRNLFETGLKDNDSLYKGVLTGITRIAQANLFSGLNHFQMYDIDSKPYSQYFGFTEDEVKAMIPEHYQEAKKWYNGYTFGKTIVYNPWSILNFIDHSFDYKAYWINTSENSLIQKSLTADKLEDVEDLINGGAITLRIDNNLILRHLEENKNAFFNLLYTSGYLTSAGDGPGPYEKLLRIPNYEVQEFFEDIVMKWFGRGGETEFLQDFLTALLDGDGDGVQNLLARIVSESFSFKDVTRKTQESFYHGVLLGVTLGLKRRYTVKSNRESGYGLYDIALFPKDPQKDPGVIIEIKTKGSADKAVEQIQRKAYSTELHEHGCNMIHLYGMKFDGKKVTTKLVTEKPSILS